MYSEFIDKEDFDQKSMCSSSIGQEDQTFELKKKLKILKKAIIQEREEKTLLKITITEKQERITNLNVELLQKDQQLKELMDKLGEREVGLRVAEKTSIDILNTRDEALKYNIKISDLTLRITDLEKQQEDQIRISQYHQNEQKKIQQSYLFVSKQQEEGIELYNKKTEELKNLQAKYEELEIFNRTLTIRTQQTEFELIKFKAQIEGMKAQIVQKQEEIGLMEDKLQVYDAKKIMMLSPVECQITLRRNITNKCFINIETPSEAVEIPARDIQDLNRVDTCPKQFILKHMGANRQIIVEHIEIEDPLKLKNICKQIKRFIVQSEDERREQLKEQSKIGEEKSFFSQFSSIFQN